jgi:hypothetical protein
MRDNSRVKVALWLVALLIGAFVVWRSLPATLALMQQGGGRDDVAGVGPLIRTIEFGVPGAGILLILISIWRILRGLFGRA